MLDGIMCGQRTFEWSGLTEISSFWLRDSFFLPADKRSRSPSEHTHAGSLPATQRAAVASSFYECDVGVSPTPGVPQKGTFLWVTGTPACAPPADIKYLRTCQFREQPTEDFDCVCACAARGHDGTSRWILHLAVSSWSWLS